MKNGSRDFYKRPGEMTNAGKYQALLKAQPGDVGALASIIQGIVLHEYAASWYGVTVAEERRNESHLRHVELLLERILELDERPLVLPRNPERRLVGVCHHFALLMTAVLRAKGIPARARCGFGAFFNPGGYEDHWVSEYWKNGENRWVLVDAQLDQVWRKKLSIDFDPLDVPRDKFLIAGDAWSRCRAGDADPATFGIFVGQQRGLWFIAGNIIRDIASFSKIEMLPWDVWGRMPKPNEELSPDALAYFDRLATLTQTPAVPELREAYANDPDLQVPDRVFNAIRQRMEPVRPLD